MNRRFGALAVGVLVGIGGLVATAAPAIANPTAMSATAAPYGVAGHPTKPGKIFQTIGAVKILGSANVGKKLTAKPGKWSPAPQKFTYQWYRSGKSIAKATKSTYTLTAKDAGEKITVSVTASRSGYQSVTTVAKPIKKVSQAAKQSNSMDIRADAGQKVGVLTVNSIKITKVAPGRMDAPKYHYVIADVTFKATAKANSTYHGGLRVNSSGFAVVDKSGYQYDEAIAFGVDRTLALTTLNPGEKARGLIIFDAPPRGKIVFDYPGYQKVSIAYSN